MKVRFALHLDRIDPEPLQTGLGVASVGPQGLLQLLETDLGLPPVTATSAERLVAYRGCLAELDNPGRFYHRSFALDSMGVARTLSNWREAWYEAGWQGTFEAGAAARLVDLSAVEQLAAVQVPLGTSQRAARVCAALTNRRTQVRELSLLQSFESLPLVWQRLADLLGYVEEAVTANTVAARGDLAQIQRYLLGQPHEAELTGDGTVSVIRSSSRDISAEWVAEYLHGLPRHESLVVAEHDGIILDNAFERAGLPRVGFQHYSRFRAASQVIKLVLALVWKPVDPQLVLQFLLHPISPLSNKVRGVLAQAVSDEPGIGGTAWNKAVESLSSDDTTDVREVLAQWLEVQRFTPAEGAPIPMLIERTQEVARWLRRRAETTTTAAQRSMYRSAALQGVSLLNTLRALAQQNIAKLTRIDLDQLVDETAELQPDPDVFAQAHHVAATNDVRSIVRNWDNIVWWDMRETPLAPLQQTWSNHELADLNNAGVALSSIEQQIALRGQSAQHAVLRTTDTLTLVLHETDERAAHPLWTELASAFANIPIANLETELLHAERQRISGVEVQPLPVTPLPPLARWWHFDGQSFPARPVESYSSLSQLYFAPHSWVLNYAAMLRLGRAEDLSDQGRLYGNLAHRLVEHFFTAQPLWSMLSQEAILSWTQTALPELLEREGAVLLTAGRGVDRQRVTTTIERALVALLHHLHQAGVSQVQTEVSQECRFTNGVDLRGSLDLLCTLPDGREVIIDMKYGGERYRRQDMEDNVHLQLAMYGYMRRNRRGWPAVAYFIIESGRMIASDNSVFPDAVVAASDARDLDDLWSWQLHTYRWRREQLARGRVEVNAGAEPTVESTPPDAGLETRVAPSRFDDFLNLAGWEPYA